ncbi:MAG: AAA family ATPase, partial [Phyllobacteriaceae bacterium]|nr:AAA family ATPase [Phyllobacteriaceae bacterium]
MNGDTLTTAPKFRLVSIAEIDFVRGSPDLVRGLLPNRGLAVLYGASGCGKSFLALDVALHVSLGRSWASQRVEQAGVVYVAAEGAVGFRRRVVAARERLGAWEAPFAMIDAAPNLGAAPGDGPELVASIRAQSLPMGWLPGLVVIDTTARVIPGLEENSAKDMGVFIANADFVAQELRCVVLLIHHSGKSLEAGMRGSSALHGA